MDLGAYMQIDDLSKIAEANGISVPRLRGYRLMVKEKVLSEEDIREAIQSNSGWIYERMCCSVPRFHPNADSLEFSPATRRFKKKYLITEDEDLGNGKTYSKTVGFRWELIHGKNRKRLKFALKQLEKRVRKNFETFNKYVGRADVLYIHARIGGRNWVAYGGAKLEKQPWFIEKVDDYFDSTYCDIYARIKCDNPELLEGEG